MSESYEVNGQKIYVTPSNSKFTRTANQIHTEILHNLKKIGIEPPHITLELARNPLKKELPAEISWEVNGESFYYSCDKQENYRDNLGVIGKVVEMEVYAIRNGLKSFTQVMNQFRLGYDENYVRVKSPREILGVPKGVNDLDFINFRYKQLCKEKHPDVGGTAKEFEEISKARDDLIDEVNK